MEDPSVSVRDFAPPCKFVSHPSRLTSVFNNFTMEDPSVSDRDFAVNPCMAVIRKASLPPEADNIVIRMYDEGIIDLFSRTVQLREDLIAAGGRPSRPLIDDRLSASEEGETEMLEIELEYWSRELENWGGFLKTRQWVFEMKEEARERYRGRKLPDRREENQAELLPDPGEENQAELLPDPREENQARLFAEYAEHQRWKIARFSFDYIYDKCTLHEHWRQKLDLEHMLEIIERQLREIQDEQKARSTGTKAAGSNTVAPTQKVDAPENFSDYKPSSSKQGVDKGTKRKAEDMGPLGENSSHNPPCPREPAFDPFATFVMGPRSPEAKGGAFDSHLPSPGENSSRKPPCPREPSLDPFGASAMDIRSDHEDVAPQSRPAPF